MSRLQRILSSLAPMCVLGALLPSSAFGAPKELGLKSALQKELAYFDDSCGLTLASDQPLYKYVDKRLPKSSSWQVDWSTRKLLATVVPLPTIGTPTDSKIVTNVIRRLVDGTQLASVKSSLNPLVAKKSREDSVAT